jgi:hypothetical protein
MANAIAISPAGVPIPIRLPEPKSLTLFRSYAHLSELYIDAENLNPIPKPYYTFQPVGLGKFRSFILDKNPTSNLSFQIGSEGIMVVENKEKDKLYVCWVREQN